MESESVKKRLAECLDPCDRIPLTLSQMGKLLRDALAVIEQQEQAWLKEHSHTCLHHTDAEREKSGCPVCLQTRIAQLEAQLRKREAQFAAMREALSQSWTDIQHWLQLAINHRKVLGEKADFEPYCPTAMGIDESERVIKLIGKALSTDAGRDLLERLQTAESALALCAPQPKGAQ